MIIAGIYSLKNGRQTIEDHYDTELAEIKQIIAAVDGELYRTKVSKEKTMKDRLLYSPKGLNRAVKAEFIKRGWENHRIACAYPTQYYTEEYTPSSVASGAFRDMDFIKNKVGIEVQFGKYAFAVYNICAKMTIFHNQGFIDVGVEIVPVKELADQMSNGVTYFEQLVWDLEQRGIADIDVPVLILGIMSRGKPE